MALCSTVFSVSAKDHLLSSTGLNTQLAVDPSVLSSPLNNPTGKLRLSQVLALALTQNPELAAYSKEIRAREAATLQASLMPNPTLKARASNFGNNAFKNFDGDTVMFRLSQTVELGGKRAARTKAATLTQELAHWDYQSKRIDVLTQSTQAFITVLVAQQAVDLQQQLLHLSQQVLQAAMAQVEAGRVTPLEATKAKISEASSRVKLMRSKRQLEVARQRLSITWGSIEPRFTQVLGHLKMIQQPPRLATLLQRLEQNPDMARWATEMTQRHAIIDREQSKAIPNINVMIGTVHKMIPGDTTLMAGLSIPLQLFDRNQGRILEAQQRLNKAVDIRRHTQIQITHRLKTRYQALITAYNTVKTLQQEIIPGAQNAFDAANRGYRLGKFSFLDVLDAQRTLFDVKAQYLQAQADYHLSVTHIERLIGGALFKTDKNLPN